MLAENRRQAKQRQKEKKKAKKLAKKAPNNQQQETAAKDEQAEQPVLDENANKQVSSPPSSNSSKSPSPVPADRISRSVSPVVMVGETQRSVMEASEERVPPVPSAPSHVQTSQDPIRAQLKIDTVQLKPMVEKAAEKRYSPKEKAMLRTEHRKEAMSKPPSSNSLQSGNVYENNEGWSSATSRRGQQPRQRGGRSFRDRDRRNASGTAPAAVAETQVPMTTEKSHEVFGWKEVKRKSNKLFVPSNVIARVIGRGGHNINAIRESSGAHIEVDKQQKSQNERERVVTLRGPPDAMNAAILMINGLINEADKPVEEIITKVKGVRILKQENTCAERPRAGSKEPAKFPEVTVWPQPAATGGKQQSAKKTGKEGGARVTTTSAPAITTVAYSQVNFSTATATVAAGKAMPKTIEASKPQPASEYSPFATPNVWNQNKSTNSAHTPAKMNFASVVAHGVASVPSVVTTIVPSIAADSMTPAKAPGYRTAACGSPQLQQTAANATSALATPFATHQQPHSIQFSPTIAPPNKPSPNTSSGGSQSDPSPRSASTAGLTPSVARLFNSPALIAASAAIPSISVADVSPVTQTNVSSGSIYQTQSQPAPRNLFQSTAAMNHSPAPPESPPLPLGRLGMGLVDSIQQPSSTFVAPRPASASPVMSGKILTGGVDPLAVGSGRSSAQSAHFHATGNYGNGPTAPSASFSPPTTSAQSVDRNHVFAWGDALGLGSQSNAFGEKIEKRSWLRKSHETHFNISQKI